MRGSINPRDHRFRPRVVVVVGVWKDFLSGDGTLSSPGCAGILYEHQPTSDRLVGLVSTWCEAVSNRGNSVFVPGLSELHMYGRISDPGIGNFLPGVRGLCVQAPANQRSASGPGVPIPCGAVSTRRITVFVLRLSELQRYERISDPGMGFYCPQVALTLRSSPIQSAIGRWGCGFHTVRGGVDPEGHRFRPRFVGVVDIWEDF